MCTKRNNLILISKGNYIISNNVYYMQVLQAIFWGKIEPREGRKTPKKVVVNTRRYWD
jgi:hypothetical protein